MDPLGFGLENFDGIGRWREKEKERTVDASGTLPGGESFRGPIELVGVLGKRQDAFRRHLARTLLTYALGRGLEYYDACAVDRIVEATRQGGDRFSALVTEIAHSEPFLKRRGGGVGVRAESGVRSPESKNQADRLRSGVIDDAGRRTPDARREAGDRNGS
jgi:hypothetical protein